MTILHFEDSDADALLIQELIRDEWPDCTIHRIATRREYESALEREQFDLILCDHQMPGFDGARALEWARQRRPGKPFVFISGTIGEERAIDALKRGADDYVIKDRPARLVPAMRQALERVEQAARKREVEESLRQNQERFRQITEAVGDMITVHDRAGRCVYSNPAHTTMMGGSEQVRTGTPFAEVHPEDRERVRATFEAVWGAGQAQRLEYRLRVPAGERFIESQFGVLRGATGEVESVLIVARDVTEHRLALQLEAHLLRAQRSESIGALSGGIAHDLNNMLAPILLGAELLREETLTPPALRAVDAIAASARYGAELVHQLLIFARGSDGERTGVSPQHLLEETYTLLRKTLAGRVEVRLELPPGLRPVLGNATQLKQIILNLCINARDAMPQGGTITIAARDVVLGAAEARIMPEGQPGPHLHIRVTDTGSGIPAEILDRIFDPFFTTKAPGKGTGLGLSLVHGVVKGHRGFLRVESTPGVGTTFHIYLPTLDVTSLPAIE
ncbi:MAG TPA: ATP-binding protein [Opitutaceae bacterium]